MPNGFQRILLATEHTEFDQGAERVALELARHCALPLRVVRPLVSNPEYEALAPAVAERAAREAAKGMDELRAQAQGVGVELTVKVRSGEEPWREIVDEAVSAQADLLVTRRRGKRSWLARLLVGEMVSKVVGHAPCPVLMVPRAAHMWTGGVLAAVDGSPISAHVAQAAAVVAQRCNAPLTIACVAASEAQAEVERAQAAIFEASAAATAAGALKVNGRLLAGTVHEHLLAAADPKDLIVIGRHVHTALHGTALGGTVHKVIGLAVGPVLVVK